MKCCVFAFSSHTISAVSVAISTFVFFGSAVAQAPALFAGSAARAQMKAARAARSKGRMSGLREERRESLYPAARPPSRLAHLGRHPLLAAARHQVAPALRAAHRPPRAQQ